jgi:signal transduction histidine kinase
VAHEINNPLSYVLASLGHLEEELARLGARAGEAAQELRDVVGEARAGGKRIQQIVQDLTTFSRPDKSGVENVALEDVLRFALRMAGPSFPSETRVEERFQPVPVVRANPGLLSQVFVNLLANAGRALGGVPADRRVLEVGIEPVAAGNVQVTVRDQGVGIPELLLTSIFDPFFTTQPQGEGTGLGLYICQGIVQRMGGEIRIESRESVGTLARVVLPLAPPARAVERPPTVGVLAAPARPRA